MEQKPNQNILQNWATGRIFLNGAENIVEFLKINLFIANFIGCHVGPDAFDADGHDEFG
jgi:hypothetical protein